MRLSHTTIAQLGDWLFEHRKTAKAYENKPELFLELLVGSLAFKIRQQNPEILKNIGTCDKSGADILWDHYTYGPHDCQGNKY